MYIVFHQRKQLRISYQGVQVLRHENQFPQYWLHCTGSKKRAGLFWLRLHFYLSAYLWEWAPDFQEQLPTYFQLGGRHQCLGYSEFDIPTWMLAEGWPCPVNKTPLLLFHQQQILDLNVSSTRVQLVSKTKIQVVKGISNFHPLLSDQVHAIDKNKNKV